jgi:hypothetical protein
MSIDNNFIIFKELNTFANNIQDYKNKILMHGLKTKFENLKIFYALEKLSELESTFYKKFVLYWSIDKEIDKEILVNTITLIENQYQKLLSKYFFKL